jgi:hypothetical protein
MYFNRYNIGLIESVIHSVQYHDPLGNSVIHSV